MAQSQVPPVPPPPPSKVAQPTPAKEKRKDAPSLMQLVRLAHEKGFSDIHLGVGKIPFFRNRGDMVRTDYPQTSETTFYGWMKEIFRDEDIRKFRAEFDFDGAAQYEFTRVRVNAFMSLRGPAMVLRLIPMKIKSLDDLGFPEVFKNLCIEHSQGLILVTGPTGSGKSTTIAAMIDYINRTQAKHVVTIEDPIEFVHRNHKSLINQREVGIHTTEFKRALRAVLREDPDVILIGEMRDQITVNTALQAAQTGHLVLGTLHTNSAVSTIERLLNIFDPTEQDVMRYQVAESLVAVLAQVLVQTTDGKRTAAQEIMVNTDTIKDWIQKGDIEEIEDIMPRSSYYGMQSMNQSLYQLYEYGKITEETALSASPNPNDMMMRLKGVNMA
ncbi:MAG: type IV pilus twitching motility protein PilT [Merismopedia sp. SIO2A8]|nr:type IV pilus twitching motility protein PilT [Symploca sp. SIO2B6]NET52483.1 type IV pilus twitching motility protein PilT [Merismopedia sp. SIO2A8]